MIWNRNKKQLMII